MIFYFSGTGNSRFIAKRIQEKTGDEMYSLNEAIKQKKIFLRKNAGNSSFCSACLCMENSGNCGNLDSKVEI